MLDFFAEKSARASVVLRAAFFVGTGRTAKELRIPAMAKGEVINVCLRLEEGVILVALACQEAQIAGTTKEAAA